MFNFALGFVAGAALGAYFGPQVRAAFAWAGKLFKEKVEPYL